MDSLVARIVAAGLTSAIFTYFLVQLVVKPALARRGEQWWHSLATNALTLLIAVLAAFGLTFLMVDAFTWKIAVEAIFVGIIAASAATFGHEVVKNYGQRNVVNVGGDQVDGDKIQGDTFSVDSIEDSDGVTLGSDSEAKIEHQK